MSEKKIRIAAVGSISSLGYDSVSVHESYRNTNTAIQKIQFGDRNCWGAPLSGEAEIKLQEFIRQFPSHRHTDRTVHMAMYATQEAFQKSGWTKESIGAINIGSSRGATQLWEEHHTYYLQHHQSKLKTSPYTTLGNISSYVANMLQHEGMIIDHSVTCSSGMMAMMNGIAWLQSGMCNRFIAGAAEAPLSAFTVAQMEALGIYSSDEHTYPCRPFDFETNKKNSMVLGEGSVAVCMEMVNEDELQPGDVYIHSWGVAKENVDSPTGISSDGIALQKSMQQALSKGCNPDLIIAHAPGTMHGDQSEWNAIHTVFHQAPPTITSTKWKTGHTLGTSGLMSVELGILAMQHSLSIDLPYLQNKESRTDNIQSFMVNAIGFGGNATSIIIAKKK